MSKCEWADTVKSIVDKIDITRTEKVRVDDFISLIESFKILYRKIFTKPMIRNKLIVNLDFSLNNLTKERERLQNNPETLKMLLDTELKNKPSLKSRKHKTKSLIVHILWLNRTLWLLLTCIDYTLKRKPTPLHQAYTDTIQIYHGKLTSIVFRTMLRCEGDNGNSFSNITNMERVHLDFIILQLRSIYLHIYNLLCDIDANFDDKV